MQIYFHLTSAFLLHRTVAPEASLGPMLFFGIAPDLPMIVNFAAQCIRKRGRGLVKDDIASWKWTYPAALFLHSMVGFAVLGAMAWLWASRTGDRSLLAGFAWAYGSHLGLDYLSHGRDPYPPLYPFSKRALCTRFSYYEADRHATAVNWTMRVVTALGMLAVGWN